MKKLTLLLFIFSIISASCHHSNKLKVPDDILSPDSMADILTDVHLVQASQRLGMVLDTADTAAFTSFNYVWKKHRITESEYKKCLDYYSHNPRILDSIYEKVLNNLSKQKAELLGQKKPIKK